MGCSVRWTWTGNKWTGKSGWRMGRAEIVRGVALLLDSLEKHLVQIKSQDGEGKIATPGG